jgi:hypothetical protein
VAGELVARHALALLSRRNNWRLSSRLDGDLIA